MRLVTAALAAAILVAACAPSEARRHHRTPATTPPQAAPHEYYPQNVEGGSPGNLPFNNQIRKHTDPLNANGGR